MIAVVVAHTWSQRINRVLQMATSVLAELRSTRNGLITTTEGKKAPCRRSTIARLGLTVPTLSSCQIGQIHLARFTNGKLRWVRPYGFGLIIPIPANIRLPLSKAIQPLAVRGIAIAVLGTELLGLILLKITISLSKSAPSLIRCSRLKTPGSRAVAKGGVATLPVKSGMKSDNLKEILKPFQLLMLASVK